MKNWEEIRDSFLKALKFDEVTEEMKSNLTKWLLAELLPIVEEAAKDFLDTIKKQAAEEKDWCKIRDGVVLPVIINGGLLLVETILKKTIEKTA